MKKDDAKYYVLCYLSIDKIHNKMLIESDFRCGYIGLLQILPYTLHFLQLYVLLLLKINDLVNKMKEAFMSIAWLLTCVLKGYVHILHMNVNM